MTRQNAQLRLLLAAARQDRDRGARFLAGDGRFGPGTFAGRLGRPGRHELVCRAGSQRGPSGLARQGAPVCRGESEKGRRSRRPVAKAPRRHRLIRGRPPSCSRWTVHGQARAQIQIWTDGEAAVDQARLAGSAAHRAWESWAAMVADRAVLERRVQTVVESLRQQIDHEDDRLQAAQARGPGRIRGRGRPRAQQSPGGDCRPGAALARPHRRSRNDAVAPHHPQPGGTCSSHSPRSDVRGPSARPEAAAVPAGRSASRMPARSSRRMHRTGHSSRAARSTSQRRRARSIPTRCGISPRSCFVTRSRRHPPAARSLCGRACEDDELSWSFTDSGKGISPRRRRPPVRSVLLRPPGGTRPGPRLAARRQAGRAGRRTPALVVKPRSWVGLPGPFARCHQPVPEKRRFAHHRVSRRRRNRPPTGNSRRPTVAMRTPCPTDRDAARTRNSRREADSPHQR